MPKDKDEIRELSHSSPVKSPPGRIENGKEIGKRCDP